MFYRSSSLAATITINVCLGNTVNWNVLSYWSFIYNTIQYNIKTYNAPYVTKMLFVGAECLTVFHSGWYRCDCCWCWLSSVMLLCCFYQCSDIVWVQRDAWRLAIITTTQHPVSLWQRNTVCCSVSAASWWSCKRTNGKNNFNICL